MKAAVIFVCLIIGCALALRPEEKAFHSFMKKYGKVYASHEEFNRRFAIFKDNLKAAEQLNAQNPKAKFGVTKFSDLTAAEQKGMYRMSTVDFSAFEAYPVKTDFTGPANVAGCAPNPTNYDWTSCGCTTPIYNQGECGSCGAFTATETIETYFYLGSGTLVPLSIEQIVDCDTSDYGCEGGFPTTAYEYVESAGGIEPASDYPYIAEGGQSGNCSVNSADFVCTVTSISAVTGETGLYSQLSVASGGPVSVCVDASSWPSYQGGVLTQCGTNVDHCVQLVGYQGYGAAGSYWIVRNSWGADWGEQGYIYVEIGQDLCSIGDYATIVTAAAVH